MNIKKCLPILVSSLALGACSKSTDYNFDSSVENARAAGVANLAPEALFNPDPANLQLPSPTSLAFNGSQDLTLNIGLSEGVAEDNYGDPTVALNTLDGFSNTQPFTAAFGGELDPTSIVLGETLHVFEVTTDLATGAVTSVVAPVVDGLLATAVGSTLTIVPLVPLKESTDYMMIATKGIKGTNGVPVSPSSSFRLVSGATELAGPLAGLEGLRGLTNLMVNAAVDQGIQKNAIALAWTVKTQSITPVMEAVKGISAAGGAMGVQPIGLTTQGLDPRLPGVADIYVGSLEVPYYLTAPTSNVDVAGTRSFWRGPEESFLTRLNPTPVIKSRRNIPVLMSVPNAASGRTAPAAGWPVVIFIHGVGGSRLNMLPLADIMAQYGFAVVAIDQVMHGITDTDNGLYAAGSERTFNMDLVNNTTGAPGPDGVIDPSGTYFYSPAQLLATRDNLRQSAADQLVLSASIANIQGVALDASHKAVVGHSLGGSTATVFAAMDDSLKSVSLGMPAAGMVTTTITSAAFGPPIVRGLSALGVEPGTASFNSFLLGSQTVIDAADPINFATRAATNNPVHVIEVLGETVVRNSIGNDICLTESTDESPCEPVSFPGAALAGTEALVRLMGLPAVTAETSGPGVVRFTAGGHGSLLSPDPSPEATVEMQTQLATFASSLGTLIPVTNASVIKTSE